MTAIFTIVPYPVWVRGILLDSSLLMSHGSGPERVLLSPVLAIGPCNDADHSNRVDSRGEQPSLYGAAIFRGATVSVQEWIRDSGHTDGGCHKPIHGFT